MKTLKFIICVLLCVSIGTTKAQTITDLHSFSNGEAPTGSLVYYPATPTILYGMTPYGGSSYNDGQIFEYNLTTNTYTSIQSFSGSIGANPFGSVLPWGTFSNPILYGMTSAGGASNYGVIFSYDLSTNILGILHTFTGTYGTSDGATPYGSLTAYLTSTGSYLLGMTSAGGYYGFGMIFSYEITYPYTFTDLHDFNGTDGWGPCGDLTLVTNNGDAVVYGMTYQGGGPGYGNIFSYDLITNTYADLFDFTGVPDSQYPYGNLLYTTTAGGTLYGMTNAGGSNTVGNIFSYNIPSNTETSLLSFLCTIHSCPNGSNPYGSLAMAGDKLFGMNTISNSGDGYIFSYDPYTNSYSAIGNFTGSNGSTPYGNVTLASGVLYGMASAGGSGSNPSGVIFQLGKIGSSPICDVGMDTSASITCSGVGSLSVSPFYGVSPYTYLWNPSSQTTATATGLTADSYTVTVTDNTGCSASQTIVLDQPSAMTTYTETTCFGGSGWAGAFPSGGTSPYTYSWSPGGSTTNTISGLTSGFYTVTVTDNSGCTETSLVAVCIMSHHSDKEENDSVTQLESGISLYPNPNNGQFTITGVESGMLIKVYDYTGRLISNITVGNTTMLFNISTQPNGIYLIRILSSDGQLVKQTKIVKTE